MQQTFSDLKHQMHRVSPLNGEGPICASVRKMSVAEASDCAVSIVALYRDVARLGDADQSMLPMDAENSEIVPPFLVKSN